MSVIESPRFPKNWAFKTSSGTGYKVTIVVLSSGKEKRFIEWSNPRRSFNVVYPRSLAEIETIESWFKVCFGTAHTFRVHDKKDYKSCLLADTPAFDDQIIGVGDGSTLTYQVIKTYQQGSLTNSIDIVKIVAGTFLHGIAGVQDTGDHWTIDNNTGINTYVNKTGTITGATSADPCVLTSAGHTAVAGDSVYLSTFTSPWDILNTNRYAVTSVGASTITIDFDSSSLAAYSGNGGQFDTLPQSSESITAGFEYDIHCRFDIQDLDMIHENKDHAGMTIPLIEVIGAE